MKLLTLARDLARRRARERQGLFLCEGVRAVEELLRSPLRVRGLLVAPQLAEAPRGAALHEEVRRLDLPVADVSDAEFASAAQTDSPQGVLAIAEVPNHGVDSLPTAGPLRLLVLDAVQDPGNVGTILRTAAAFGVTATVALPGTVDLWNAKVVRSAMGALFHHPAFSCTWDQLDPFRTRHSMMCWATDAAGAPLTPEVAQQAPERLALVVGNEGNGISAASRTRADRLVALPITAAVESLNVAVAAGIFLYVLRR